MYIEIYEMSVTPGPKLNVNLVAICDSFSSLLWDVEYYSCGTFEVYISATPENLRTFQKGRIVGRNDDKRNYGIIEKIQLNADAENGDYLTVSGRFLMSLLSRRIIYPTQYYTLETSYSDIVKNTIYIICIWHVTYRGIPGLKISESSSPCWHKTAHLQVSYENLMEWVYKICETVGGTANIRLEKSTDDEYSLVFELSQGTDRSVLQNENPHIIFSDTYNNLLSFDYMLDATDYSNFAYIFGSGEGAKRKNTMFHNTEKMPSLFDRYEIYVDAKDLSDEKQDGNETTEIPTEEYLNMLRERGKEKLVSITEKSESTIAVNDRQFKYNRDYFLGDYVTVQHDRFGLRQPKIQLVGMIESFDQNGYSLTPTFKGE
ncbi:MAG: siphovirus ReqiPepy6 Gp37-like family protein [Ruminococcus sp.]|nr:siphovirus ReqiPepy6 Gp37-like family protein [Ruminococcus sp.]MDE6847866.1 siphovirus ReqiPepy6 Gp37-like family protein [Ruminococcus sp.]